ncbi:DUF4198 domain-containing protein [Polaromonas sp.]|uniref:DUF4198 domain-containing protein n=1 Tax=Polaromonas sp. TaxID=1869339 RepID=UPI0037521BDF
MKIFTHCLVAFSLAWGPAHVMAHEFWMLAQPASHAALQTAKLSIQVGTYFEGEQLPFTPAYIARLQQVSCGKTLDITPTLRQTVNTSSFQTPLGCRGTHLFALDSHPNVIALPADKFTAYLEDEGLEDILKLREDAATTALPGRERYRRHIKALFQTAGASPDTRSIREVSSRPTDQTLEIVPVDNSLAKPSDSSMRFKVLFKGKPLDQKLVKAWHRHAGQTLIIRARTDRNGLVDFNLPYTGPWMLSVVHMLASTGTENVDWDSFWGNLTFNLMTGRTPGLPHR